MLSPTHIAKYQEYCSQKWHSNQMESYGMLIVNEDISSSSQLIFCKHTVTQEAQY